MNDDAPLTPERFNYVDCAVCEQPTPVPLTWAMRPPGAGEPDPPRRTVMHSRCADTFARIPDDAPRADDLAEDGEP